MDRSKLTFLREPTVYLQGAQIVLTLLVAFKIFGVTEELSALILALGGAVLGAINALKVRPLAPAAFTMLVTTAAPLLAYFGLSLSTEQTGALQFAIVTFLALVVRTQVSPVADLAPTAPDAGPVR
jgi:hypothetical protein